MLSDSTYWMILLVLASACAGCVRRTGRDLNDNFYVIRNNGKGRTVSYDARGTSKSSPLSTSINETLKAQAGNSPTRKNSVSNAEILEKDNPEFSALLGKTQNGSASAEVYFQLGKAYQDFRIYDEAQRYFQRAIQLEPENASYHEQFGRLWRDSGALELGVNSVQQALLLKPEAAATWNTLGTLYDKLGRRKQAQEAYLKAVEIDPALGYVHSNLSFSYLQDENLDRAIYYGQKAIRLNPSLAVAHNNLGLAFGMQGDFAAALEEFRLAGDEAAARNNLGLVFMGQNRLSDAMEEFKRAARLRPFYRSASENYRVARSAKFRRDRSSKEQSIAPYVFGMDLWPESVQLPSLAFPLSPAGAGLLDGLSNHLLRPLSLDSLRPAPWSTPRKRIERAISFEIVRPAVLRHEGDFVAGLLRDSRHRLAGISEARGQSECTVLYYRAGFSQAALELAHRIPGNQVVLRSSGSEQRFEVKVVLGTDILSQAAKLQMVP